MVESLEREGYDSPEQAAIGRRAFAAVRVVASQVHDNNAYVLLDAGSETQPYLCGSICSRRDGRWFELASKNGPGWSHFSPDNLATMSFWGKAPAGADMVRVLFKKRLREEPVVHSAYFVVWWQEPYDEKEWPVVHSFRIRGNWTDQ